MEQDDRYKQVDEYMKNHPEVKAMTGHSKGAKVVDDWIRNHPDRNIKARVCAEPTDDLLGMDKWKDRLNTFNTLRNASYDAQRYQNPAEKWLEDKVVDKVTSWLGLDKVQGMKERGVQRVKNNYDVVGSFDNSADAYDHPNWMNYLANGGPHDYHNVASLFAVFDGDGSGQNHGDRPGHGPDPNYRGIAPTITTPNNNTPSIKSTPNTSTSVNTDATAIKAV